MEEPVRLLDIRDEVHVVKRLVLSIYLASQAPTMPTGEGGALCEVADIARHRLEAIERALDLLITTEARKSRRVR